MQELVAQYEAKVNYKLIYKNNYCGLIINWPMK